ncbi:hypothetical protein [Natronococcus amylolyticus]|uniref:hypothetical protein n=1 Tax=Natronococcus amylolyticus TaxID=44470 RepID=UPI00126787AE|nr:hypothetical protein [Natronococcus amylolyticus]
MVIVEKEEGPILFFDLGQATYGETTFKSYYSRTLGYLSNNDHISLQNKERPIDIVISHLHKDHFKNLTTEFIETLIDETEVSLHGIWSPPVDILLTTEDRTNQIDQSGGIPPLNEINSDIAELFDKLYEFSSSNEQAKKAQVYNHFITSHRTSNSLEETFEIDWLSPPSTTVQDYEKGLEKLGITDFDSFSPVLNANAYIQKLSKDRGEIELASGHLIPFLYSPTSLLLTPQESFERYGLDAILPENDAGSTDNVFTNLDPVISQYISDGENSDIANRVNTILKLKDIETGTTALLTGDATSETLSYLLSEHEEELKDVNLLQVPHHGSNNGNISPIFFSTVRADHAFIAHGSLEEYGHPRPETLADLILAGTAFVHQVTASNDFMYTDEGSQVFSNKRALGEEIRNIIDENIIIPSSDLVENLTADEIIKKYKMADIDNVGLNRTIYDIFSKSDFEVRFGKYGKEITVHDILDQLDIDTNIGLIEASRHLSSIKEDPLLLDILEQKRPVIVCPPDIRLKDLSEAIRKLGEEERIERLYKRDDVIVDRTEEQTKTLETDEEIARHIIIFESIMTSDSDFLADHPPKDADIKQLLHYDETTREHVEELRGTKIKNRQILHDIYTQTESPPPERMESDFKAGDLLGFTPERLDNRNSFKKSDTHTRHYPVEMSSGFLSNGNDYLGWVIENHPEYTNIPSHKFIARRTIELVSQKSFLQMKY